MIVRRFLLWARGAPPGRRAVALGALARAFLGSDLSPDERREADTAMTAMLDDPSPIVRRALAEALAGAPEAPRHLVVALAGDRGDIAALVLARSPVLADADLVDCAALGDDLVQAAIASRPRLSVGVSAALAEVAGPDALVRLVANAGAALAEGSFARMVERHGGHGPLREAMLARADLPLPVRQAIAVALADTLSRFVVGCGWLSSPRAARAVGEARDGAAVAMSAEAGWSEVERLVDHLRRSGHLTPALMLRAVLSRNLPFAEAAFAQLSGLPASRVAGILHDRRGTGFSALCKRAGLPASLRPAFEAAVSGLREGGRDDGPNAGARLSRLMIERALTACAHLDANEAGKLMALLRRFEVEAARDEARELAEALADEAALAAVEAHVAGMLSADAPEPFRNAA